MKKNGVATYSKAAVGRKSVQDEAGVPCQDEARGISEGRVASEASAEAENAVISGTDDVSHDLGSSGALKHVNLIPDRTPEKLPIDAIESDSDTDCCSNADSELSEFESVLDSVNGYSMKYVKTFLDFLRRKNVKAHDKVVAERMAMRKSCESESSGEDCADDDDWVLKAFSKPSIDDALKN